MITLNNKNRLHFLWHFLVRAAKINQGLEPSIIHEVFGSSKDDFDRITNICTDYNVASPVHLIADQNGPAAPFDQEMISRMIHSIPDFSQFSEKAQQDLDFLAAKYCLLAYDPTSGESSIFAALVFWQSLDPEAVPDLVKCQFYELLSKINKVYFLPEQQRNEKKEQIYIEWEQFHNFTSAHSFLVIHHKDWSKTLEGT